MDLIHRYYWNKIGGLSEEFNPGIGSDPDLNFKLWKNNVRIFKGLEKFRKEMINDKRLKFIYDFENAKECFQKDINLGFLKLLHGICLYLVLGL